MDNTIPRLAVLECVRKEDEQASLQHSSMASTLGLFLATEFITSVETLSKTGTK